MDVQSSSSIIQTIQVIIPHSTTFCKSVKIIEDYCLHRVIIKILKLNISELAALTKIQNIGGCEWQEVNELRKKEWFKNVTRDFYKFRHCKNSPQKKRRSDEKCCENLDEVNLNCILLQAK